MSTSNVEILVLLRDLLSAPAKKAEHSLEDLSKEVGRLDAALAAGHITNEEYGQSLTRIQVHASKTIDHQDRLKRKTEEVSRAAKEAAESHKKHEKALKGLSKTVGHFGDKLANMVGEGSSTLSKFGGLVAGTVLSIVQDLGSVMKMAGRFGAIGGLIAAAIPVIFALGGAVLALVGHFGQMIGVAAALPGIFTALGLGMATMVIGFQGISEAVKVLADSKSTMLQIAEATRGMNPAAKAFAVSLANLMPKFKEIRNAVQESMLPTLQNVIESLASNYLPSVISQFGQMGAVIARVATKFKDAFTTPQALTDFNKIFDSSRVIVGKLGEAFVSVMVGMRGLIVAAIPLTEKLSETFRGMAERFANFASSGDGRSRMAAFFERGRVAAVQLWHIIRDLSIGIWNIASAGRDMGNVMGGSLETMMAKFRAWTTSVDGNKSITNFYNGIKDTLGAIGRLIGALAKEFGSLGTNEHGSSAIVQVLDAITGFIPTLGSFLRAATVVLDIIMQITTFLGPWVVLFLYIGTKVLMVANALLLASGNVGILARVLPFLGAAFDLALGPWGLLLGAIIILFYELWQHSETFRNAIYALGRGLAVVWVDFIEGAKQGIGWVKSLIDWISKVHLPGSNEDGSKRTIGSAFEDAWQHPFGIPGHDGPRNPLAGRRDGGPVWSGQTFTVGEEGRELFLGASGKVDMLGAMGQATTRFSEPGIVIPNPVTEAIMQSVTAPSVANGSSDRQGYMDALPAITVDARGFSQADATSMIAEAIRQSRASAETMYSRRA